MGRKSRNKLLRERRVKESSGKFPVESGGNILKKEIRPEIQTIGEHYEAITNFVEGG